jgi:hypothetical protein
VDYTPWLGSSDLTMPSVAYVAPTGTINVGNPTVTATAVAGASSSLSAKMQLAGPNPGNSWGAYNTYFISCTVDNSGNISCPTSGLASPLVPGNYTATVTVVDGNSKMADSTGNFTIVDSTPPVTTDNAPATWQSHDVTVTLSCTDDITGCASTTYAVDNGAVQTGNSVTISAEGVHTITYHSVDKAGNVEGDKTATVKIDKTNPTISASATTTNGTYTAGTWTNQSVTVHFTCSDSGSGIASCPADVVYSSDGVTATTSGTATDKAGNSASASFGSVNIDKTAPVVAITSPTPLYVPAITGTVSDAATSSGSLVATMSIDGAAATSCSISAGGDIDCPIGPGVSNGSRSVTISVTDGAGNTGTTAPSTIDYEAHGQPSLGVSVTRVYWASYSDYTADRLSVDYKLTNGSTGITAVNVQIVGTHSTNGVLLSTGTPVVVGDILAGAGQSFTLQYLVPSGTSQFVTSLYATAQDPTGTSYSYPGPYTP